MKKTLNILMLEDNADDAEIIQHFLKKSIPGCSFKLVASKPHFVDALDNYAADLVLSDNTLPSFNATEALSIFKEKALPIPFILVTGTVSEEFAAGIIRSGADDYLLKDRLTRLPSAINNALEKKQAAAATKAAEALIRFKADLLKSVGQAVIATDGSGIIIYWNHVAESLYGCTTANSMGQKLADILPVQQSKADIIAMKKAIQNGITWSGELLIQHRNGRWFPAFVSDSPLLDHDGKINGTIRVSYDLTAQKQTEANLRAMEKQLAQEQIKKQKEISRAILQGQEEEKNHIGQELHDNINQILASAKMFMVMASRKNPDVKDALQYPIELLNSSIEEIRNLTYKQVTPLKNIQLKIQLQRLVDNVKQTAAIQTDFTYQLNEQLMDDELKLTIFRIVQEQLNNIIKHASATTVTLLLEQSATQLHINIADDGVGFDATLDKKGIGIANMTNRVSSFEGEIQISSRPGNGCIVAVKIPL